MRDKGKAGNCGVDKGDQGKARITGMVKKEQKSGECGLDKGMQWNTGGHGVDNLE